MDNIEYALRTLLGARRFHQQALEIPMTESDKKDHEDKIKSLTIAIDKLKK